MGKERQNMLSEDNIKDAFRLFTALGLAGGPNSRETTALAIAAWLDVLGDMDPNDFAAGARLAARTCKFWPKPAEVVEAAPSTHRRAAASLEAEADRAVDWWPMVQRAVGSAGKDSDDDRLRRYVESEAGRAGLTVSDDAWESILRGIDACGGTRAIGLAPVDAGWLGAAFKRAAKAQRDGGHVHSLADERERRKRLPHGNPKRIGGD